jgi:hypothetical protein
MPLPLLTMKMTTTIAAVAGGAGCHALPSLQPIQSRRMPLVDIVDVTNHGRRRWHEGIWGMVVRTVEEEQVRTVVFDHQVTIRPGLDDGGKRSGVTLVRLCGRQR